MNRRQRRSARRRLERLQKALFALTRYVVDADPYALIEQVADEILSITDYALAARHAGIEPGEKVEAYGTRNLVGTDLAEWQAEMLAVAARATKVTSPVLHIILSLRTNETWSEQERDEAITIVLKTLGLERCQAIWAQHSNTSHPHLHLSVVRIDPVSGRAAGTDWLIDDLHQSMAIVEERQGRVREPNALYLARDGVVFDTETGTMVRDGNGHYISDWYKAKGKKRTWLPTGLMQIRAGLVQAAEEAATWSDLHHAFAEIGAVYDKSGSGARISAGGNAAKASEIHGTLSRPELQKRLGQFEPDLERLDVEFEAYGDAVAAQLTWLRHRRDEECRVIERWMVTRLAELPSGVSRTLSSAVREEAEQATKALKQAFADAIRRCTVQKISRDKWIASRRPAKPEEVSTPAVMFPGTFDSPEASWSPSLEFERHNINWATEYRSRDGDVLFTDHRAIIIIHAAENIQAIDEALRIASERWTNVRLTGPSRFVELATQRAHELGIEAVDAAGNRLAPKERCAGAADSKVESVPEAPETDSVFSRHQAKRVDDALSYLALYQFLPIRRRQMPADTKRSGRTGPFEIVVAAAYNPTLDSHAILDYDERVQAFLKRKYEKMIGEWTKQLLECCPGPLPSAGNAIVRSLSPDGHSRWLAQLAYGDADFQQMLEEVRAGLLTRKPAKVPPARSEEDPASVGNEQTEYERATAQQEWLSSRSARGK